MPVQRNCQIISSEPLCDDVVSVWLEAGALAGQAQAGQFVHVRCGDGFLLRRPISVCRTDEERLNLVIQTRGAGTEWLISRQPGEMLDLLGPLGHGFSFPAGKVLVVGGGIGVPPMLYTALCSKSGAVACLGFRSAKNALLLPEFYNACEEVYCTSDDGTMGERGFVAEAAEKALSEHSEIAAVLACGPRVMLKTVAAVAKAHGVPCQVSMEERMGCGIGACLVCACKMADGSYRHVCQDGPIFDAEEVCWDD